MSDGPGWDTSSAGYDARAATYATFGTGVLAEAALAALPEGGSVLDVGCASGGLLELFEGKATRRVGIEVSPKAAAAARAHADEVLVADVATMDPDLFPPDSFDLVVCADVLEHLPDPVVALRQASAWCKPGGNVIVSVPNVAYWKVRLGLLRGQFSYAESGILDAGHLRFFTEDTLRQMVQGAGLDVREVRPVLPHLRAHLPVDRMNPRIARHAASGFGALSRWRPRMFAFQYVCRAQRT